MGWQLALLLALAALAMPLHGQELDSNDQGMEVMLCAFPFLRKDSLLLRIIGS